MHNYAQQYAMHNYEKICTNIKVPIEVFIFKAINEDAIEDVNRRKLVREISPLMDKIANYLYSEGETDLLDARKESLSGFLEKQ